MGNIATLERLIKDIIAIKDKMIVEGYNEHSSDFDRLSFYSCQLPDSTKESYIEWKASVQRFIYQIGDWISLHSIRDSIAKLDGFFNGINMNGDHPDVFSSFDYIINSLNNLKIICEENFSNKVFIVHGHSELLIAQTKNFVMELGFVPVVLRDQASQGKTIIEKLESNTDVTFAIVLYTACDRGSINDKKAPLKPRARQNVVFEHGYLNSKLGRNRVCALVEEGVESPGDLAGVVYIPIDKGGVWKVIVAKEMKAAGLDVDFNKVVI
jgi:predicted nucleotide-binding protein